MFSKLGKCIQLVSLLPAPRKKYLYYQHNGLVMVTAACVDVFMAPQLSFRVSAKLRDGATVANLSPAFKSIIFHAGHGGQPRRRLRLLRLCGGGCLSLPRKHHDGHRRPFPASRHGRHRRHHLLVHPALAGCLFCDPLHNYGAPASMKTQYNLYSPRSNRSKITTLNPSMMNHLCRDTYGATHRLKLNLAI